MKANKTLIWCAVIVAGIIFGGRETLLVSHNVWFKLLPTGISHIEKISLSIMAPMLLVLVSAVACGVAITRDKTFSALWLRLFVRLYFILIWVYSIGVAHRLWGTGAVIVGIILAVVGVIPVAMLAALFHGEWAALSCLFAMLFTAGVFNMIAFRWRMAGMASDYVAEVQQTQFEKARNVTPVP
jgi:hypothetical protein